MNFLAHLVLAPPTARGRLGSIAPDMIRGPLPSHLDAQVVAAAREHQRIDAFTDAHPAFLRTRDRLRGVVDPRLAGVLADVLYDHVLASRWSTYR
ncbi:MAG: ACP phosphodiesterase, partial [Phycisphaeraceae bacterium]